MDFAELEQKVIEWADEKGILAANNIDAQILKSVEELGEFSKAVQSGDVEQIKLELGDVFVTLILVNEISGDNKWSSYLPDLADHLFWGNHKPMTSAQYSRLFCAAVGNWWAVIDDDCYRTALNFANKAADSYGFTVTEALEAAYNKISKRKGSMVNGAFVKEGV